MRTRRACALHRKPKEGRLRRETLGFPSVRDRPRLRAQPARILAAAGYGGKPWGFPLFVIGRAAGAARKESCRGRLLVELRADHFEDAAVLLVVGLEARRGLLRRHVPRLQRVELVV